MARAFSPPCRIVSSPRLPRPTSASNCLPPVATARGTVFLPRDDDERAHCKAVIAEEVAAAGQQLLGWRAVPNRPDAADIGNAARASMPAMEQLFIGACEVEGDALERKLYLIRKAATHRLRTDGTLTERLLLFFVSLSAKVIIYKGMLTPHQLFPFYPDLEDVDYESHLAMVHSRFSTNTFPSWDRAQPNRFMSHNGEINTLLGNKNWMNARQGVAKSELFGDDLSKLFPVVEPDCSDSGTFDNVLEFLLMTGRTLQEAVLMMIPEGLAATPGHGCGQAGVLRIPLLFNGTLGWPGLDRVHRWHLHRCCARPERTATIPLLRHRRRQMHHGFRGRRC